MTKKTIENELHRIKTFIDKNVRSKVITNSSNKRYNAYQKVMAYTDRNYKLPNENKQKNKFTIDKESIIFKNYLSCVNNPSICPQKIKKKYPKLSKLGYAKYTNTFNQTYHTKALSTITIAFKKSKDTTSNYQFYSKDKKKLTQAVRFKLKWKTIKWLMEEKKDIIDKLLDPYMQKQMLHYAKKKYKDNYKGLTYEEFALFLCNNGITNNPIVIRKLYWIMDEDGKNEVEYNEIFITLEIFRKSSAKEKVEEFFKLCDTDNSNSVSKEKFLKVVKKSIVNQEHLFTIKEIVNKIFKEFDSNGNGELTLEDLTNGFKKNKELAEIINQNSMELKALGEGIDKDIEKDLLKFNPDQDLKLRQKLFGHKCDYYPSKSISFMNMMTEYIKTKENLALHKAKVIEYQNEYCTNINTDEDEEINQNEYDKRLRLYRKVHSIIRRDLSKYK